MKRYSLFLIIAALLLALWPMEVWADGNADVPQFERPVVESMDQLLTIEQLNNYILSYLPTEPEEIRRLYIAEDAVNDFSDPVIQEAANELYRSAETDRERVRNACAFVAMNMRYEDYGTDKWHRPASKLLREGYGMCADYVSLASAVLNAMGIPVASVVLFADNGSMKGSTLAVRNYLASEHSLSDSLSDQLPLGVGHALIIPYVDGAWRITDITFMDGGLSGADMIDWSCFDMDVGTLSKTHVLVYVGPPGDIYSRSSKDSRVLGSTDRAFIVNDRLTAMKDRYVASPAQEVAMMAPETFISLDDFANVLFEVGGESDKSFSMAGSMFHYSIIPGVAPVARPHELTYGDRAAYNLEPYAGDTTEWEYGSRGMILFGVGHVVHWKEAIIRNRPDGSQRIYLSHDVLYEVCQLLDIYIEVSDTATTVDTRRPFSDSPAVQ